MADLDFQRTGENLVIKTYNNSDSIRIQNMFDQNTPSIDRIYFEDQTVLENQMLDSLISAMAGFNPESSVVTGAALAAEWENSSVMLAVAV